MSDTEMMTTDYVDEYARFEGIHEKGDGDGRTYMSIFDGTFCQRSGTEVPDWEESVSRHPITKVESPVWIKRFDRIVARVIHIDKEKKEFETGGKVVNWNMTLLSNGKKLLVRFKWPERVLLRFLKVSPNLDFSRPFVMSAWGSKNRTTGTFQQACAFYQPIDPNPANWPMDVKLWDKVPEYWKRPLDASGKPIEDSIAIGADGSRLPQPEMDEEEEKLDFKKQERFLAQYFRDNVKPKIDQISTKYNIKSMPDAGADFAASDKPATPLAAAVSGVPAVGEEVAKPTVVHSTSLADTADSAQNYEINMMCRDLGKDPDEIVVKILGEGTKFSMLSKDAARYVIYRMMKAKAKAAAKAAGSAPPAEDPGVIRAELARREAEKQAAAEAAKKAALSTAAPDDDDDDWGTATAPAPASTKPAVAASDDDDDIPF